MSDLYIKINTAFPKDFLESLKRRIGSIPIVEELNIKLGDFSEGFFEIKVPKKKGYEGVYGSFHGGLMMTAADTAACFAILTKAGPHANMATTDMNIRFLYPCLTDLTARAKIIKFGKTLCPVAVDLFDAKENLVAVAQVTYMLLNKSVTKTP